MYLVTDLKESLPGLASSGEVQVDQLVAVEPSPDFPGELVFQVIKSQVSTFYSRYRDWMSYRLVLSEIFNLPAFHAQLIEDEWQVYFDASCEPILANLERWNTPLKIEGYDLYPFQQFSLQRAYETDLWFFNWATGAGKSLVCAAGAKELFAREQIDVVICCTTKTSKINQYRFFCDAGLDAVVNDGTKPKRKKVYAKGHQVYVMNYEKLSFDYEDLHTLTQGKRVLFIFDEVAKIVTGTFVMNTSMPKYNNARKCFVKLMRSAATVKIWPMSASVVNGNPLKFRDVFALDSPPKHPLGSKESFEKRYADEIKHTELETESGKKFTVTHYEWNLAKLQDLRHRVGNRTQTARKTDPGIAHLFKELQTIVEPIQLSRDEIKVQEAIIDLAFEAWQKNKTLKPYYDLLRLTCNTPLALRHSNHEVAAQLASDFGSTLDKISSSKVEHLNEQLEAMREAGDKVLVFTHWTNLTLFLIKDKIEVPLVEHHGGQSAAESQVAQDAFKSSPDITCFLTSDAGQMGLNMQCSRVVIQFDPTYSYDDTYQRASRIHRADSYLDGLTNYIYVTDNSVEERVWRVNHSGRVINEAVQGTTESLNYGSSELTWEDRERAQRSEAENLPWLIFGSRIE